MDNIIVINKDKDYTSRDVVNVIGKIFNTKKVGHTGTLDPLATGVLIVCMNKALKVVDLITASDKEYIAKVVLGIDTDTLDITGNIINECKTDVNVDMVKSVLNSFVGKSIQEVPKYSAVKVKGKKLYEYARNGIDVELPKREIQIFDIELISDIDIVDGHQEFSFKVKVSKGTYIRSLIRDIGVKLGCFACMKELIRTKQGKFSIDKSYTLNDIKNGNYKLLNIKDVIDIEKVVVSDNMLFKIKNGMILDKFFISDKALILDNKGNEIGIYKTYDKDSEKVKPDKIF